MTLELIFFIIVLVVFAFRVGWIAREIHAKNAIKELLDSVDPELIEPQGHPTPRISVNIEKYQGQYFAYDRDSNFLGQGESLAELHRTLSKRFPGTEFTISEENAKDLDTV